MKTDDLFKAVREWGRNKNLKDPIMQSCKVTEEIGEINHEITRNRFHSDELKDALGDSIVTLIILADILGYDLVDCLEAAYNVIKDRRGKTINGSFVREQ